MLLRRYRQLLFSTLATARCVCSRPIRGRIQLESPHALALLVRKLAAHARLDDDDRAAIMALPFTVRSINASTYLVREGEPPMSCGVLLSGFAFRHKLAGHGARAILSLHVPGEPLDFQTLFLDCADHNIQALTAAEVAMMPRAAIRALMRARPNVAEAVVASILVEASVSREWLLNVARRDARTRLAHLLCEFAIRMEGQGLGVEGSYQLPMNQEQIGDALGLTSVHVNRTLKALEKDGMIERRGRNVIFPDIAALRQMADFDALYLHLDDPAR